MSRKIPSLRRHSTGVATVRLDGKDYYFGRFGTPDAEAKYRAKIAEWLRKKGEHVPRSITVAAIDSRVTVSEVIVSYCDHAVTYYRHADGTPTGETANMRDAVRQVLRLYGQSAATSFGVRELERVRAEMVRSGLARGTVNARVNRVRRVFTWAASQGMVPGSVPGDLKTLAPLRKGRTEAVEADGIGPVAVATVEATLPFLAGPVADMVRIQLYSGMRVGEVLSVRVGDVERSVDPWEYRPGRHKGTWRGKDRVVPLGPRSREILLPYMARPADAYLFRPTGGKLGRYDRRTYRQAIVRGCDRAFPHPSQATASADELRAWRLDHRWTPLQLRHTAATVIRLRFGLEAAQVVLGHAKADVTQIYADRDLAKAREVAASMG